MEPQKAESSPAIVAAISPEEIDLILKALEELPKAIETLKAVLSAVPKYFDEQEKMPPELYQHHIDSVKALQAAWNDAAKRAAEYRTQLALAGETTDPIGTKYDEERKQTHAKFETDRQIAQSKGDTGEAKTREEDAKKGMSPEAIANDIAQIQMRTQKSVAAITDREKGEDIRLMQQEQAERANSAGADDKAVADAQKKTITAKALFDSDEAQRKSLIEAGWDHPLTKGEIIGLREKNPHDERVALADAQDELDLRKEQLKYNPDSFFHQVRVDDSQAKVNDAQIAVDRIQKWFDQLNAHLDKREQKVTDAFADEGRAEKISIQDKARATELTPEIFQAKTLENERLRGENIAGVRLSTAAPAGANTTSAEPSSRTAPATIKSPVDSQAATIVALYKFLEISQQNSTAILNLIMSGIQHQEAANRAIVNIQAQMRHLQSTGFR